MDKDKALRTELIFQLTKGHAHMNLADAVADFPEDAMNEKFTNGDYTFWHLLEHIRRTQSDILEFTIDPNYKDKEWPKDYWPEKDAKATKADWEKTIKGFHEDQQKLKAWIEDEKNDLYVPYPHGTGQTLLREIHVVIDHNAYHIGEFAIMRQVFNTWKK